MDYSTRFNNQTHNFLDAVQSYENVLDEEMMTAIKMLDLKQNEILLNAFAGGIPIDKYIDKSLNIQYLEYDTNKGFSNTDIIHYTIDNIPIKSQSIDKILCLATLHHFNNHSSNNFSSRCSSNRCRLNSNNNFIKSRHNPSLLTCLQDFPRSQNNSSSHRW